MARVEYQDLLDAGAHFGHLRSKWNPKMAPYIFMEARGIHIIDLNKTIAKLDEAAAAMKQIAKSGKKILLVATKKQAKDIVANASKSVGMPYITERWPGGMLTNFATVRKSVKKMAAIDKMATDGTFANISKRERLQFTRTKMKMEKLLGSITDLSRLPAAIFIVDINKEHIAVAEARKLNIPTFAIVDTNTDPTLIDFVIPANDDASKSIALIVDTIVKAIQEGLSERRTDREAEKEGADEEVAVEAAPAVAVAEGESATAEIVMTDDEEEPVVPSSAVKAVKVVEGDKKRPGLRPRKAKPGPKGSKDEE